MQYAVVLVWLVSAVICHWIAKARSVKPTPFWAIIFAFFGPLTIPMLFFAKREQASESI